MLRARRRASGGWPGACILSRPRRGVLTIPTTGPTAVTGSMIELRHGEHVIVGEVVWRKGTRAGLRTDGRVPVEEIMALGTASALQLTAGDWPRADRRKQPRSHDENRLRSRAIEFAGVAVIAASLAATLFSMVDAAFARPLAIVQAALGG